jgi:hypothetical protein
MEYCEFENSFKKYLKIHIIDESSLKDYNKQVGEAKVRRKTNSQIEICFTLVACVFHI